MKAILISQTGGPDVLQYTEVPTPQPKPNEALVKIAAAGVNFIDVYHREGRYPVKLPFVLGRRAPVPSPKSAARFAISRSAIAWHTPA